jgi:hypothetical protein
MAGSIGYARFEALTIGLGGGADLFTIEGTHSGTTLLNGGPGTRSTSPHRRLSRGWKAEAARTTCWSTWMGKRVGALLELDGQAGADLYTIWLAGQPFDALTPVSLIDVDDTGSDAGADSLVVYGPDDPLTGDNFLLRAEFLALLPAAIPGQSPTAERVNYNASLEGLAIHGRAGDDVFSLDDNSAPTTIYGGEGADRFQVGQLFQSPREWSQVAAGDEIDTFTTTRGWLSAGTSRAPPSTAGRATTASRSSTMGPRCS